eukprot:CAMPEP_0206249490 /NCGR_PEP_ID=MMETSP0047_2-20121206/20936_1 /ASSEMBLY_ACC=CAM_ASM_000192 /TAXON_ID=195065 /ORGANISM="Chroomonas mesostigmatica_cf, Strain CCMP1168" /LENGTH=183 /DNA_ID=CAMNT_0053675215 /DNA_START=15 /DNA_END=562 /DNA_ORIENTATION=+
MAFKWPDKKQDVALEATGARELDEEDGFIAPSSEPEKPAAASTGSLADLFKPKPGQWRCADCMTMNEATATHMCASCEAKKPDAPTAAGAPAAAPSFQFGTPAAPSSTGGSSGSAFTFGASSGSATAFGSGSSGFSFGAASKPAATASEPAKEKETPAPAAGRGAAVACRHVQAQAWAVEVCG